MHPDASLLVLTEALRAFAEATQDYDRLVEVVGRTTAKLVGDGCVVGFRTCPPGSAAQDR
ncbi:MAG: hypothetical protein RL385_2978 [Pseudomonadota bacterium]